MPDLLPDPWREALLESSLDCVIIMDASGRIVDFNRGTAETLGLNREAAIGRRLGEVLVPPELRDRHAAGLARYLATGQSTILGTRIEVPALHASGRRIPTELSIVRLRGTDPPLFVGHLRTIEARLRSQRRLRVSAGVHAVLALESDVDAAVGRTLAALGEGLGWVCVQFWSVIESPAGLTLRAWWQRPDPPMDLGKFRGINTFAPGLGLPGRVLTAGEPSWIEDLQSEAHFPRLELAIAAGFRTAMALPVHVRGRVVAVIEAFSQEREARDEELLRLLGALGSQLGHFIEESGIRAERDAMLLREQQANRLKDEFLAMVSHELRTPLSPILGWARMLLGHPSTPASMRAGLESIERNAILQSHLVEDLLDVSGIIAGKLKIAPVATASAAAIVASVETVRAAASGKGVTLAVDAPEALPQVLADPKRLQQIISNVLSNAVKFTPPGGAIAVTGREAGAMLEIVVQDSGAGIDPAFLPRVFDRFRQADSGTTRSSGGLGLGLSIVRDLVTAHGGSVRVESDGAGRGTIVTIGLPIYQMSPTVKPSGNGS